MNNISIISRGGVSIDTDDDGVFYLKTQSGETETIENDIALTALIRVKELELLVAQLSIEIETLKSGR